jgi:hypothetical protein
LIRYFFIFAFLPLFSCGIEDYIYLDPVENAYAVGVSNAIITMPNNSSSYFRYYTIFYRIYISDIVLASITSDSQRNTINPALASHYNTIDPYTTNDSVSPNAIASVFNNLKYYPLHVSTDKSNEFAMYQLLSTSPSGSLPFSYQSIDNGDIINLDFTDTANGPYMVINYASPAYTTYPAFPLYLFRAKERFTPLPDRLFYHTADLIKPEYLTSNINADVERKTNIIDANPKQVYVSMYILATGIDNNYTLVYSRPKHIGIFHLPVKP